MLGLRVATPTPMEMIEKAYGMINAKTDDAFISDNDQALEKWLKINADYAKIWPNLTQKRDPLPEATEYDGVADKFENHFSPEPGEGD